MLEFPLNCSVPAKIDKQSRIRRCLDFSGFFFHLSPCRIAFIPHRVQKCIAHDRRSKWAWRWPTRSSMTAGCFASGRPACNAWTIWRFSWCASRSWACFTVRRALVALCHSSREEYQKNVAVFSWENCWFAPSQKFRAVFSSRPRDLGANLFSMFVLWFFFQQEWATATFRRSFRASRSVSICPARWWDWFCPSMTSVMCSLRWLSVISAGVVIVLAGLH